MQKREALLLTLLLAFIVFAAVLIMRTRTQISFPLNDDIIKIAYQYNNPSKKGGVLEDKEMIYDLMNYFNHASYKKVFLQKQTAGYYLLLSIDCNDNRHIRMMIFEDYVEVNGAQYKTNNNLNLDTIDCILQKCSN